ncbi:hypothetical protein TNCV_3819891 [Trichonephila clavipes]|uniref:Uncharacterized protein n=1 Tax=Trichonephila clavipes TaxID=2585209 RepID=A0A8X6R6Z4_TRICX|nr:hypothetical protein TNCV_3819891 [Trichonephila clavipes]
MNLTWRNPPAHHWYAAKKPCLSLQCRSSTAHQTAVVRFRSGRLRDEIPEQDKFRLYALATTAWKTLNNVLLLDS